MSTEVTSRVSRNPYCLCYYCLCCCLSYVCTVVTVVVVEARSPPITRPGSARATPRISLWCVGSPVHHPGTSRFYSLLFCCAVCCLLLYCLLLMRAAFAILFVVTQYTLLSSLSSGSLPFLLLIALCCRLIRYQFCCYRVVKKLGGKQNVPASSRR